MEIGRARVTPLASVTSYVDYGTEKRVCRSAVVDYGNWPCLAHFVFSDKKVSKKVAHPKMPKLSGK